MRQRAQLARAWTIISLLVIGTFAAALALSYAVPPATPDEFDVVDWELRHLPGKWLHMGGRLVHGRLSMQEEDARVARYLDLTRRIDRLLGVGGGDQAAARESADLEGQRQTIENDVEAILAGRVTETLEDVGLESSLPLFPKARWIFPPVAVEFDGPPNELVISPRDRIELIEARPLRHDLSPAEVVALEAGEERGADRSALVAPLSGVATYPSLVEPDWDYRRLVEVVVHEWVHQYLFFNPLGRNFRSSLELRTLNETVAAFAAEELAFLVLLKSPLHPPYDNPLVVQRPVVDVGAVLRQLRTDVDALLAFGQIDAAEALMEQRRRELADQGVVYRRINQAFFAFRSVYATEPGSTDPIGLKIVALRNRAGSVGGFLREVSQFTSETDLDRALSGG